jgi:hypothetical protein
MPNVTIHIKSKTDPGPAVKTRDGSTAIIAKLTDFVILEGGMQSGKTSVAIFFDLADGTQCFAETSGEIFNGMAVTLKGANEFFESKQNQEGGNGKG